MPFKLQGSSTRVIKPCYDGRALPGTFEVAGDGLALLSIKDCHQNCTLSCNSDSKLPLLSCTQGTKPRNSFRNLHKPDVRKVRGIENPTTESIIKLFQTHNLDRCCSNSYRKKVLRKLGSIITKKSKTDTQPQTLDQNTSWPINFCVLSSLCQEREMVTPEILVNKNLSKHQDILNEITINKEDFEASDSKILNNEVEKDTVFLTLPVSNMHENTSDDLIPVRNLLDPSNGDSFTKTTPPFNAGNPRTCLGYGSCDEAISSSQEMSLSILLESKQSQHQISIPSNLEFYKIKENDGIKKDRANILTATKANQPELENIDLLSNIIYNGNRISVTENPSSAVVQSIFSDIFQDIEEIKDAISSYMSSFYVHEEEYDNFPALHKPPKEVTSHFFDQLHGSLKVNKNNSKTDQNTFSHSFPGNLEGGCLLEQSSKEDANTKVHKKSPDIHFLQENTASENPIKNYAEKGTPDCYCYWDDNELGNDKQSQKTVDCNISESKTNRALVPLEFIENIWEEFTTQVETHAIFLDLVNENETKKFDSYERNFPSYGHWSNMYDQGIFEEVENIVHTIDSLFMNGSFPADESNNASAYIPCTIVELLDDREFMYEPVESPNENGNKPGNEDGNIPMKQQNHTMSDKNEVMGNENNKFMSQSSINEVTNRLKIHEIKLEPVFNQEKVTIHEIDYSREPEYEKINLNPITHEGRVSFSSLHPDSPNYDSPVAVEMMKHNKEQINDNIIFRENASLNYTDIENSPKMLLRAASKDQLTPDSGSSMFERIPEKNSPGNTNPAFLFSSPTVEINLTNTFINSNRK